MKINRNGPYMMNDAKKRYTEVKNSVKKDGEKKFQKETTNEKKKIDWEKEKDVLQKYIGKKYPLMSKQKISKIIEEKADKYIDIDHYHEYVMKQQSKILTDNIRKSKKLSDASDEVKSLFETEAKEQSAYSSSDEDEDEDNIDDEQGSDNDHTNDDDDEEENDISCDRKRKNENSNLEDTNASKKPKKSEMITDWLPNGDKVNILYF